MSKHFAEETPDRVPRLFHHYARVRYYTVYVKAWELECI